MQFVYVLSLILRFIPSKDERGTFIYFILCISEYVVKKI